MSDRTDADHPARHRFEAVYQWDDAYTALCRTDTPLSADEFLDLSVRVGRNWAPALLFVATDFSLMSREVLGAVICDCWEMPEYPTQALANHVAYNTDDADFTYADAEEQWVLWFRAAGFRVGETLSEPPDVPVTLYRGAPERHRLGMSWTDDLATARWFAERWRVTEPASVWTTTCAPERLLARPIGRSDSSGKTEGEWVTVPPQAHLVTVVED